MVFPSVPWDIQQGPEWCRAGHPGHWPSEAHATGALPRCAGKGGTPGTVLPALGATGRQGPQHCSALVLLSDLQEQTGDYQQQCPVTSGGPLIIRGTSVAVPRPMKTVYYPRCWDSHFLCICMFSPEREIFIPPTLSLPCPILALNPNLVSIPALVV